MRVLFFVPYVPSAIYVRPYYFIRHLASRGHEITLFTLYSGEEDYVRARALEEFCQSVIALRLPRQRALWNMIRALPTRSPLQSAYCWLPEMARELDSVLRASEQSDQKPFDIVHVEHLRGARYGLHVKQHRAIEKVLNRPAIVWDSVDSISLLFRRAAKNSSSLFGRWITRFELGRTESYEPWLARQFDQILLTSQADKNAFKQLARDGSGTAPISVLPNGVELSYFTPPADTLRDQETLVVSGKMSYHANVTMVIFLIKDVMPLVWARRPTVKVVIAGKNPTRTIRALGDHPLIKVTGTVPDLRPYLQRATIAVAPVTYGVGIQNKVLEAMACGTPVIATSQATSALKAVSQKDLITADTPSAFAEAIIELLEDPARREALGRSGRAYVEQNHDWAVVAAKLEEVYIEAGRQV